jgi:hypothetical protein
MARILFQGISIDFYCYFAQEGLRTGMGVLGYPPSSQGALLGKIGPVERMGAVIAPIHLSPYGNQWKGTPSQPPSNLQQNFVLNA